MMNVFIWRNIVICIMDVMRNYVSARCLWFIGLQDEFYLFISNI